MRDEEPSKTAPEDLIAYDQMIPIMIDLQIIESHYQNKYQRPNLYQSALDSSSQIIFNDYEVSKEQYGRSYQYYSSDLSIMFMMLETTLDSVNARVTRNQEP